MIRRRGPNLQSYLPIPVGISGPSVPRLYKLRLDVHSNYQIWMLHLSGGEDSEELGRIDDTVRIVDDLGGQTTLYAVLRQRMYCRNCMSMTRKF